MIWSDLIFIPLLVQAPSYYFKSYSLAEGRREIP